MLNVRDSDCNNYLLYRETQIKMATFTSQVGKKVSYFWVIPMEAYFTETSWFPKAYFTDKLSLFNNWQKSFRAWLCAEFSLNFMLKPNVDHGYVIMTKEGFLPYFLLECLLEDMEIGFIVFLCFTWHSRGKKRIWTRQIKIFITKSWVVH